MKNKEPLILAVVVFFSLVTYYLVEPYAHHVMHKHVESENFAYADLPAITKTGNAANGKELVMNAGCAGCHSIEKAGMPAPMDAVMAAQSYGVNPPDLSDAGAIYDAKFLADLIKNPAHALKVEHKYDAAQGKMHPMVPFYGMGGDMDQEVADMVAYLQSIAISPADVTPKIAFENACGRCHSVSYEKWTQVGSKPAFKHKKDELAFDIKVLEYQDSLKAYMGKLPPDLSMYIRSRNEQFISTLIENPQNHLAGTAMPRVGVTADTADKVIEYMKDAGDTKRHERESVGMNVMIYIVIFAIFALLWKKQVWRDLH
ncbi:ubiquinol cytochrome c oxidoreductase, cytochrome c1 subunit [Sulfurimonas gotlandica GD1]|uniref:Ubiquinol cytochrome c oxidoreductase, cytochrome c1 subunit n=1 Tax=Sulfurimonas gotlandica (strain DSM 19862 / JCM 16533 / GD1) TaxID=929558 RepID=B6BHS0_SULGG|nr:c-type cytochrome [Sulfurimonas gotlandica]EDZ63430.1 ubiquinol Cytochrome c oxidoreductase, cytochrome C1 subunit [Sulfurimonas gotlandica GD1]EHP30071.1 ubiquinol cytochrome c oxidoreductase, cytochrome c1 subunit [Sulfurimonas gotlandica GD1]